MANEENVKRKNSGSADLASALSPEAAKALAKAFARRNAAVKVMGTPVAAPSQPVQKTAGSPMPNIPAGKEFRVVFAGGGTGGHLYPALAAAEVLKSRGARCLFFDSGHGIGKDIVPKSGYEIKTIIAQGLGGNLLDKIIACFKMGIGTVQSFFALKKFNPDVIVGSGGYVCAPVILAGLLLKIPVVLMEQNAFAGKAIKLFSQAAEKVCISMPGNYDGIPKDKLVLTGNPIRSSIMNMSASQARAGLKIEKDRFCIAVMGGSQGAAALNNGILSFIPKIAGKKITVIHVTGPKHAEEVSARSSEVVKDTGIDYRVLPYCEDMASLYAAADLIVCRSGATTLAEITAKGIPSVLIPYPYAAENHQEANARVLEAKGAAVVVLDKNIETELSNVLLSLIKNQEKLRSMALAAVSLGRPDAARNAAAQIIAAGMRRRI